MEVIIKGDLSENLQKWFNDSKHDIGIISSSSFDWAVVGNYDSSEHKMSESYEYKKVVQWLVVELGLFKVWF